ncbi:hypothetical protein H2200_000407 [Cladophialophora chaetospira]|uniref:Heterokaryon incompatibility domain-containing protein n=1 Tax=Cladophialophora chaetospira TaxID=386627 RepID=A0AA39CQX0_9EURO|nr:hypothetical protein H2200_000407 [Cladophialophora chaetospira]
MMWQLPVDGDSFRIIELLPAASGKSDSPLELKLLEVKLSSAPSYEAISYTWGSASDTGNRHPGWTVNHDSSKSIEISTTASPKRRSTSAAQVQMIGKIFGSADRVLSWLGEQTDDVDDPDEVFAPADSQDHVALWAPCTSDYFWDAALCQTTIPAEYLATGLSIREARTLVSVVKLAYWSRTWINYDVSIVDLFLRVALLVTGSGVPYFSWLSDSIRSMQRYLQLESDLAAIEKRIHEDFAPSAFMAQFSAEEINWFREALSRIFVCGDNAVDYDYDFWPAFDEKQDASKA